jgi:hypothetical protein
MNLTDLYKKKGDDAAPSASPPAVTSEKAPEPSGAPAPNFEAPPGLPQVYIDVNLKDQPLPEVIDMATAVAADTKKISARLMPGGESLCNATDIPYSPGYESKVVSDRIAQGPRVFLTSAERERFLNGEQTKVQEKDHEKGPTIAHPDTLKPGTYITGDSPAYRPG